VLLRSRLPDGRNVRDLRYNEVRQTSSHNAFQRPEGIYDQVVYWRVRSLEIDLHRGKPGRDALKKDWYIYVPFVKCEGHKDAPDHQH
jgi:hypothetical protein